VLSTMNISQPSISSMRGDIFDIINLARANNEQSEMIIQQWLAEAGYGGVGQEVVSVDPVGARPLPIGAICGRQKTMSDMSAPRTLRL
jgi:hypothetical protein